MTSINTNISAYYAQNNLRSAGAMAQSSIARLSSGNKIIKASDDVAALSVGTILRTNVSTLKTALVNANQGSTLLQIADGALARVGEILQRQKALATQTNSGTLSANEKGYLNQEFQALKTELDRIVDTTNFNGIGLINGNLASAGSLNSDVAASGTAGYTVDYTSATSSAATLTGGTSLVHTGQYFRGIDTSSIVGSDDAGEESNNLALLGDLSKANITATGFVVRENQTNYVTDRVVMSITVNGVTFTNSGDAIDTDVTNGTTSGEDAATPGLSAQTITFTSTADSTHKFDLRLAAFTSAITTDAGAQTLADGIKAELEKVTIYQKRGIDTGNAEGGITAAELGNTILDGMSGADFKISGTAFANAGAAEPGTMPSVGAFRVVSESATSASFYIKVGGVEYSNKDVTVDGDIGALNLGAANGILRMYKNGDSTANPNEYFEIDLGTNTLATIGVQNATEAKSLEDAVNKALGSSEFGGVQFQVGTDSRDTVGIALDSVSTSSLYVDDNGAAVTMDLVTGDINDIQEALDNAIGTVTARRADVGALQSRFGYASAALEVSIQNLDAARGQFLDADISEESTGFARAQVLQQAAISVLAQANQIPQNLLKLIG